MLLLCASVKRSVGHSVRRDARVALHTLLWYLMVVNHGGPGSERECRSLQKPSAYPSSPR